MYKNKKVIAIIPARGRNDGIKHMNLRELGSRPLIYYSIKTVLDCSFIDRVFVSTENPEIARYSKKLGIDIPFLRDRRLVGKLVLMEEIIEETLDYFKGKGEKYEYALCLYPNAPFKTRDTVIRFLELSDSYDYVIPLYGHKSFYWAVNSRSVELLFDDERSTRDKTSTKYEEIGGIYAYNIAAGAWKEASSNRRIGFCELSFHESRMVNSIYDLIMYERLIRLPDSLIQEILKYE